jgi:hypothetical protein
LRRKMARSKSMIEDFSIGGHFPNSSIFTTVMQICLLRICPHDIIRYGGHCVSWTMYVVVQKGLECHLKNPSRFI